MWDSQLQLQQQVASEASAFQLSIQHSLGSSSVNDDTQEPTTEPQTDLGINDWINTFNTSILTTRSNQSKDRSEELGDLMGTPEFAALIVAAQHLAKTQKISKELATERVIDTFRKIDRAWKQIVMKRGLQSLIE